MEPTTPRRVGRVPVPYRIEVRGGVGDPPTGALEDFTATREGERSVLVGSVVDQSHLQGILQQLGDMGVEIVSVGVSDPEAR